MLFRWANALHIQTRPGVIQRALLFKSGDRVSKRLLDEPERLLRSNRYLYDVQFRAAAYHDGVVDIELLTDAYATHGRIALYSSELVNNAAAHALRQTVTLSMGPVLSDAEVRQMMEQPDADLIGIFARACREELTALR